MFRGSARDTVFQKRRHDRAYHHRHAVLNRFYAARMSFDEGDEVLQVGFVTLLTGLRHWLGRRT